MSTRPTPPVIVAAVDLHKNSNLVLAHALDHAVALGADLVHLVYVAPPNLAGVAAPVALDAPELTGVDPSKIQDFCQKRVAELCERRPACEPPEIRVHTMAGDPAEKIVAKAAELDADLVIMATHGRSGLKHFLMGSVAEKVVRTAGCPVLVLRQKNHAG